MAKTLWIGTNKDSVWPLEHEGDYNEGDALVEITTDSSGTVQVRVHPPASE